MEKREFYIWSVQWNRLLPAILTENGIEILLESDPVLSGQDITSVSSN